MVNERDDSRCGSIRNGCDDSEKKKRSLTLAEEKDPYSGCIYWTQRGKILKFECEQSTSQIIIIK